MLFLVASHPGNYMYRIVLFPVQLSTKTTGNVTMLLKRQLLKSWVVQMEDLFVCVSVLSQQQYE